MAKFHGKVGYAELIETDPGVWEEQIVERTYTGDFTRNSCRLQTASQVNDNIDVSNEISIVADPYAYDHFHLLRYVEYMGTRWKINSVDASKYPRLILSLGGLYNGQQT